MIAALVSMEWKIFLSSLLVALAAATFLWMIISLFLHGRGFFYDHETSKKVLKLSHIYLSIFALFLTGIAALLAPEIGTSLLCMLGLIPIIWVAYFIQRLQLGFAAKLLHKLRG